jgi:hypothetical protein
MFDRLAGCLIQQRQLLSKPEKQDLRMSQFSQSLTALAAALAVGFSATAATIDSQADWELQADTRTNAEIKDGMLTPTAKTATFRSKLIKAKGKQSAASITIEQSPIWQNWNGIENVGPANLADAPVFVSVGPGNYWLFGRYGGAKKARGKKGKKGQPAVKPVPFEAKETKLDGFDLPLLTTPNPNVFNAPGGLEKGMGGYHAFQSRDMKNWVHHGPVTEGFSRWVTTAEYVDGNFYIYYDYPNDQDPHVYVDEDLTDGKPGKNMGKAFADPSDGSDCAVIRDEHGKFHVIYEDWSPINASKRSWDSPLAGRAVSPDGLKGFEIKAPAVDNRTKSTGKTATYRHPHWHQHEDWTKETSFGTYTIHEPEQEAYGDWAAIRIGTQYYLFGDYDPIGGHQMSACWFTSSSLDKQFTFCDHIGNGHPDPDIGFAEGQFYLITQQKTDQVSPGPWVETVEVRVGVDTSNDGKIDKWSDWQTVKETYDHVKGFAKHVSRTPAKLDLSSLPAGHAFQFELKLTDTTENKSKPIIDKVKLELK